jgi:TonB-dependent receptor
MTFLFRAGVLTAVLLQAALAARAVAQTAAPLEQPANAKTATNADADPAAKPPASSGGGPDPTVEEILVSGTSVTSAIDQARFSESIVDVLTAEDFAVTGDSNVVDALSRVTGVTTVGDKYVYVRGLGERYSQTLFNDSLLPSPDPFRRVIPLDLFPSGAMDQLAVQKTYAPYLPADFAGGSVQLTTRSIPAEREASMTLKVKANSRTTFQNRPWYSGGSSTDWTGFDGGSRDLPRAARELPSDARDPAQIQQAGLALNRRFVNETEFIPPGYGADLLYANSWDTRIGDVGLLIGGEADNDWQYRREERINYDYNTRGKVEYRKEAHTIHETQYSGLGTLSWKPAESQILRATVFYSHLTDDEYEQRDPIALECGDYDQTPENCTYYKSLFTEWRESALTTAQLGGSHAIDDKDLGFDWGVAFSNAAQDIPDARYYGFRYAGQPSESEATFLTDDNNTRRWEHLNDDAWDVFGKLTLPMKWSDRFLSNFQVGTKYFNKQRDKTFDQFRYLENGADDYVTLPINDIFDDVNINPDFWYLVHESFPFNSYTAEEEIVAGFLQADTELGSMFRWMVGVRYEEYSQPTTLESGDKTLLEDKKWFPATELTWLIRDDLQLRGAYSRTVNRPDMLERIDRAIYRNPNNGYLYTGDSRLEVAELSNYDLRLEWYHGLKDSVEIAGFYKDIEKPIEEVVFPVGLRSWRNAADATLYGVEVAAQQSLAPLGRWADDFTVRGNAAWIKSEAKPGTTDLQFTNKSHPLQGQSEWVANLQVTHDCIPWDLQTNIAFNWAGERLSAVGASPLPDAYEQPTPQLDFTLRYGFELFGQDLQLTFKARNLLDGTFEETRAGLPVRAYKDGRDFILQITKEF